MVIKKKQTKQKPVISGAQTSSVTVFLNYIPNVILRHHSWPSLSPFAWVSSYMTSVTDQPSLNKCPVLWFSPHWQVVLAEIIPAVQTLSSVPVCLFSGTKEFKLCLSSSQQYELKLGPQGAKTATAVPPHTHQRGQDDYQSKNLQPFWAHQAIPCGSRLHAGELPSTRNCSQVCPLRRRGPLPDIWYL